MCWVYVSGGWGEASGVPSVRRHQELPSYQTELVSATSKMDPPLAEADTISDTGGVSAITYLREDKYAVQQL